MGIGSVVTRDARDVTSQFADLVERRDVGGLGFIAVSGAVGVSLANDVVDMVLPRLGLNPDPQTSRDFLGAGLVQLAFAALLVSIGAAIGRRRPVVFAVAVALALGSVVIGGANLVEWGQRTIGRFTSEQQTLSSPQRGGSGNRNAPSRAGDGSGGGTGFDPYATA